MTFIALKNIYGRIFRNKTDVRSGSIWANPGNKGPDKLVKNLEKISQEGKVSLNPILKTLTQAMSDR